MKTPIDKTLNNKTLPFTDLSSSPELIETPINKLMGEIYQFFFVELNDDEGFSYAYEFIEKYMKIHGIKSTDTNLVVKNLFPLLIQQQSTDYIDFYDFLLRKGYANESDVHMHLLHAIVVGNYNFVRYILENVPEIDIRFALELAAKTRYLSIFLLLVENKKRELTISDSVDFSFSQESFTEDSINPYVDDSIGENHSIVTSSPNPFSLNLSTESPIAMVTDRRYDDLESPSFSNTPTHSYYSVDDNSEQTRSFDSLMMQALEESQVIEDEDWELQQRIKLVDAQATEVLKGLAIAVKETGSMLGMMENSTDISEDTQEQLVTPSTISPRANPGVYAVVQQLIASISPYKPPRTSSNSAKKRQIPVLDLDKELYLEEKNDKPLSGLTQFGVFKGEKQEPKKDSESFIPQIPK